MPPTTQPIMIICNGQDLTGHVPFESIEIVNEIPPNVGTARFTVEDGGDFGLAAWRMIAVISRDLTAIHFLGYITQMSEHKRGITLDYELECSSIEVRLQKAVVDADFEGTDTEIFALLFGSSIPSDLGDLFDTAITGIRLDDLLLNAKDMTLMDALSKLATAAGASWSMQDQGAMRLNLMYNPAFESLLYWGGTIPANGSYGSYAATWNSANVAWADGYGETGGGLQITSQLMSGNYSAFFRASRASDSAGFTIRGFNDKSATQWVGMSLRAKLDALPGLTLEAADVLVYDSQGNYVTHSLEPVFFGTVTDAWSTIYDAADVAADWPENYSIEILFHFRRATSFVISIDSLLVEQLYGAVEPAPGAYFDGDTAGAMWAGKPDESASYMPSEKKDSNWGANPNAAFDIDVGTSNVGDLTVDFPGLDSINTVIVTGGIEYESVTWEYPGDGQLIHFDLEVRVYPEAGATLPVFAKNTGSDVSPNWVNKTIVVRGDAVLGQGNDGLYDPENHWIEWYVAPTDLKRSWRVTGRIQKRIKATIQDEQNVADTGIITVDTIFDDTITTQDDAFIAGEEELARRNDPKAISFSTYEPGLLPGQEIDIVDTARSLSETLIIQRVRRNYLGGGYAKFQVECGSIEPGLDGVISEINNLAEPSVPDSAEEVALTLTALYDDNEAFLTDDNGETLYQSV